MVNWEFFDNHDAGLGAPARRRPARREPGDARPGARTGCVTWREAARILAGFNDGLATEGPTAGPADLVGLKIAQEHGWTAPEPGHGGRASGGRASEGAAVTDILTPVLTAHWDQPDSFTHRRVPAGGRVPGAAEGARHVPGRGHRDREELRAARPRRGHVPDRREVGLHPAGRRQAALPDGQRGRIRAGHLQGRPADDGHPAHAHRGRIITCYAIRAGHAFIYVRGEVLHVIRRLQLAVAEAYEAGLPRPEHPRLRLRPGRRRPRRGRRLHLRRGDRAARPRSRATAACRGTGRRSRPWRACTPARRSSTTSSRSPACRRSCRTAADWFAGAGHREVQGLRHLLAVRPRDDPGQFEAPLGITLRELLDLAGGMRGRAPAEVLDRRAARRRRCSPTSTWTCRWTSSRSPPPGRCSAPGRCRSSTRPPAWCGAALRWTEFYQHESCGKCTPCREGAYWLVRILERLEHGKGTDEDLEKILDVGDNIIGRAFCALGDSAPAPITSAVKYFRDEIIQHQKEGGCPFDPAASTVWADVSHDRADHAGHGDRHHRRVRDHRAQGHAGHPGRRDARHRRSRGSATTRCSTRSAPAGSAWWRSRASASRSPRAPPCAPRAWW